jgi:hypothetical protein
LTFQKKFLPGIHKRLSTLEKEGMIQEISICTGRKDFLEPIGE